jgi:hypothetical protein
MPKSQSQIHSSMQCQPRLKIEAPLVLGIQERPQNSATCLAMHPETTAYVSVKATSGSADHTTHMKLHS